MGSSKDTSVVYAVVKLGVKDIIVGPKEYFYLEEDCPFTLDFYDMHRLLRRKDLDVAQVTLFAL